MPGAKRERKPALANWDIFHSDRLEVEREISTEVVRAGLADGSIREDDLVRPSGVAAPWTRLGDRPLLFAEPEKKPRESHKPAPVPAPVPEPPPTLVEGEGVDFEIEDKAPANWPGKPGPMEEAEYDIIKESPALKDRQDSFGEFDLSLRDQHEGEGPVSSREVVAWDDELDEEPDPQDEDEAAAEFTLARGRSETVEELDLAAMVDVAFQLVLFFLVTATTVLYKSLEVPKPNPDSRPPEAAAQGRSKNLDDLKGEFILVEIDPAGAVKIDREPVKADFPALVERLRAARKSTDRKSMLLSADFTTPHKSAVLAYDAANEIGLGIAIAKPTAPGAEP